MLIKYHLMIFLWFLMGKSGGHGRLVGRRWRILFRRAIGTECKLYANESKIFINPNAKIFAKHLKLINRTDELPSAPNWDPIVTYTAKPILWPVIRQSTDSKLCWHYWNFHNFIGFQCEINIQQQMVEQNPGEMELLDECANQLAPTDANSYLTIVFYSVSLFYRFWPTEPKPIDSNRIDLSASPSQLNFKLSFFIRSIALFVLCFDC